MSHVQVSVQGIGFIKCFVLDDIKQVLVLLGFMTYGIAIDCLIQVLFNGISGLVEAMRQYI